LTTIARRLLVSGRVQGVFFRAWTKQQADALAVAGWVRNRDDGSVEAHVEGEQAAVDSLIELLRGGPPAARVDGLDISDAPLERARGFTVRH
jgi:acylphosphatase